MRLIVLRVARSFVALRFVIGIVRRGQSTGNWRAAAVSRSSGLQRTVSLLLTDSGVIMRMLVVSAKVRAADTVSPAEAHEIAVQAYVYLYPLVTMDLTRRQLTNAEHAEGLRGPMNEFLNIPAYPPATMREVVRPNFDTLYSSAWLDLTKEPVIVSAPDTNGRYYMLPMLDMWTDVFASPGSRTTGTRPGNWAIVPPHWTGRLPEDVDRIDSPTHYVWIIGRTKTDGPSDYDAVHKIQAGYRITPLSGWGKAPAPVRGKVDPTVDNKTAPKVQVDTMPAGKFFAYAAEVMKLQPPHITDQPILAEIRRIGLEPGKSFDIEKADARVKQALEGVAEEAQRLMASKVKTIARVVNGWSMNTDTMGVYGNYYLKRAIVSQAGLGANLPEDAIYPLNLGDKDGKPLSGANKYMLHFPKGATPPAKAFWSVTLYDMDGFQVANSLSRFALSSWMPLVLNSDGSLDLYFQNADPGKSKEANWLPAPSGPFNLTMRIYAPRSEALTGEWNPPPIAKVE
jgi:hypothetical protein